MEEKRNADAMLKLVLKALDDKKAADIRVIDISEVSVLADYFIIAGGSNRTQIQALADSVEELMGRNGYVTERKLDPSGFRGCHRAHFRFGEPPFL